MHDIAFDMPGAVHARVSDTSVWAERLNMITNAPTYYVYAHMDEGQVF